MINNFDDIEIFISFRYIENIMNLENMKENVLYRFFGKQQRKKATYMLNIQDLIHIIDGDMLRIILHLIPF